MVLNNKWVISIALSLVFLGISAFISPKDGPRWDEKTLVYDVLFALGEDKPKHFIEADEEWIKRGETLIKEGKAKGPEGESSSRISKYYQCTTCHNLVQEDPDLRKRDPEMRLDYVVEKGIPFLQATTFHGVVNRESWYNDDYVKKYGDLVRRANEDLEASIQLCATECAQGRRLEGWEMKAVKAYFWNLGFRMGDLDLSEEEWSRIEAKEDPEALIDLIKGKYMLKSPAHFAEAPPNKKKGYEGLVGRPEKGKMIYESSCQHCHKPRGVSWYVLDDNVLTFRQLVNDIPKDSHFSLYQIIRYGTYAVPGHRPYMPHYPLERMSHQQMEDLRAYIEQEAGIKGK